MKENEGCSVSSSGGFPNAAQFILRNFAKYEYVEETDTRQVEMLRKAIGKLLDYLN